MWLAFIVLSGTWDATVQFDERIVPFQLEFRTQGQTVSGAIVDGPKRYRSTSGRFQNNQLELRWDFYDSILTATLKDGQFAGTYVRRTRAGRIPRPFTARPSQPPAPPAGAPFDFSGKWLINAEANGAAARMEAVFHQKAAAVTGTVQRIDGDFGHLAGRADGRKLTLSHFDLVRATLIECEALPDGTLSGILDRKTKFTAARRGLPPPPDPATYTRFENPDQPLDFTFPDLDGNPVSLSSERFRNKAVIVTITGSWCPNCHDEAPFLLDLYRRYKDQGLEIISLGFEYTGEVERDREQLRRFAQLHKITFPVLLAGTTEEGEVVKKLPRLRNFGAFPTTFFLDRQHKPVAVHAGFAGPANPTEHRKLKAETEALVRRLLQ